MCMEESSLPELKLPAGACGLFLLVIVVLDSALWEGKSLAKVSQRSSRLHVKDCLSFCSQTTGNGRCLKIVFPPVMANPSRTSNPDCNRGTKQLFCHSRLWLHSVYQNKLGLDTAVRKAVKSLNLQGNKPWTKKPVSKTNWACGMVSANHSSNQIGNSPGTHLSSQVHAIIYAILWTSLVLQYIFLKACNRSLSLLY